MHHEFISSYKYHKEKIQKIAFFKPTNFEVDVIYCAPPSMDLKILLNQCINKLVIINVNIYINGLQSK